MITTPLNVITRFDLDSNLIVIQDLTNYELSYVGATANVTGRVKVVRNNTTYVYENNTAIPDITPLTNTTFSLPLPLNNNGNMNGGEWEIKYDIEDSSDNTIVTYEAICDICVDIPRQLDLSQTVDCLNPVFVSKDETVYTSCGVEPSLIEYAHTVSYCVNGVSPYPAPITSTTSTISTNNVYTSSSFKTELEVYLEYTFCDDIIVSKTLRRIAEKQVDCPADLCDIFCCIKGLVNLYDKAVEKGNQTKIELYRDKLLEASALITVLRESRICGKMNQSGKLIDLLKDVLGCDGDCGCDKDDQLSTLIPIQVALQTIVNSCNNGINVTAVTSGNTTTYTLCLDQDIIDQLNSIMQYNVTSATNVINVTPTTVGDTTTYQLSIVPANVPNLVNVVSGNSNLNVTGAIVSGVYTYTVTLPCQPISNIVGDGSPYDLGISSSVVGGCKTVELAQTLYSNDVELGISDNTVEIVYPNTTGYNGLGYLYGKFRTIFTDNTNYIGVPAISQNTSLIITKAIPKSSLKKAGDKISISSLLKGVIWSGALGTQFQFFINGNQIASNPTVDYNAQAYTLSVEVDVIRVDDTTIQAVAKYTYYNTANGSRFYFDETANISVASLTTNDLSFQVFTTPILNLHYITADLKRT